MNWNFSITRRKKRKLRSVLAHFSLDTKPSLGFIAFYFLAGVIVGGMWLYIKSLGLVSATSLFFFVNFLFSFFLLLQGLLNVYLMLYVWEDPNRIKQSKSPKKFLPPKYTFTALIPARHEEHVITDTIRAISRINYPENKKEIIVITRFDDEKTNEQVLQAISALTHAHIKLVHFNDYPINKPHGLNVGLNYAQKQIVVVFDAEDEPHKNIYQIANTTLLQTKADVLQSGVQLMNFRGKWFSALNVLEYFFWFKSTLPFFAKMGFIPLGGNTVFFKKTWLKKVKGWDETCLTEDAEIGMRLSKHNAKIAVIYDERHTTREETPSDVEGFIKQRTRWKQGFIQILLKGDWLQMPSRTQTLLAGYVFAFPLIELITAVYLPFSLIMTFTVKLPLVLALFSILPFYIVLLQVIIAIVGMGEFLRVYKLPASRFFPLVVIITILPYVMLLILSVLRAVVRIIGSNNTWEKTLHINDHRKGTETFTFTN